MINLINTEVSRRAFLGGSVAAVLSLEELAFAQSKEDEPWEKANKDVKQQQPALDAAVKSSDVSRVVPRFYAIEVFEPKTAPKEKWSLYFGGKQLKFVDSKAESSFKKELQSHALAYCNKKKSMNLVEKAEDAYLTLVGDIIKVAENAGDADVWLHPLLWGYKSDPAKGEPEIKAIGLVPQKFWEKGYKTHQDRLSRLVDYCGRKAGDMIRDVQYDELFRGSAPDKSSKLFLQDEGKNPTMLASWKNRAFLNQAGCVLSQKRKVSKEYQEVLANEWQASSDFKYVVRLHQARLSGAMNPAADLEARRGLADTMGYLMFFNCIPLDGKIVLYKSELMKDYKLDK